jgi:hypothetical protein
MKAIQDPVMDKYGTNYSMGFTPEFLALIEAAEAKIRHLVPSDEVSDTIIYFMIDGEDDAGCDCCTNPECIEQSIKDIRASYGDDVDIEQCATDNLGDHDSIEICTQCGRPLNIWLTWCEGVLEELEFNKPWTPEYLLKDEVFYVYAVLLSNTTGPTSDCEVSGYAKSQGGEILDKALQEREQFFQRVGQLAQAVLDADPTLVIPVIGSV